MPAGAPSKYSSIDLKTVEKLAKKGWTDAELSDFFEVDVSTWYRWKGKHPEFCEALKNWKDEADSRVERSLYERATGYEHPEVKFFKTSDDKIISEECVKHYPPDTTAGIFWLKNRKSQEWRDKVNHEMTGKDGGPMQVTGINIIAPK